MNHTITLRATFFCATFNNILITSALITPAAFAQENLSALPAIVVTATRTANTIDESMAPVTIITAEDISRLQVNSIAEILLQTPGIDIVNSGGYGSNGSVFMRGTNSDRSYIDAS